MAIYPNKERIEELMKGPADQPVVMVNLLKFKPRADATEGDASGQVAYGRYAEKMREVVESQGGALHLVGPCRLASNRRRRRPTVRCRGAGNTAASRSFEKVLERETRFELATLCLGSSGWSSDSGFCSSGSRGCGWVANRRLGEPA